MSNGIDGDVCNRGNAHDTKKMGLECGLPNGSVVLLHVGHGKEHDRYMTL